MAVALALASSLVWGSADFLGGVCSRRLQVATVTVASQATGFAVLLIWLAAAGGHLDTRAVVLGLAAGVGGAIGLSAFYKALALGTMSIVSPVVACGALVPFALSLLTGERPSRLALAGTLVALVGAVLASLDEHRAPEANRRRGALLAIAAAIAIGFFIYFLGLAGKHGHALSALLGARAGSLALLLAAALVMRTSLSLDHDSAPMVMLVGALDTGGNLLFVLASSRGFLAIVSVLGSLYPVVTVLAAHALLGERITRIQQGGVALAIAGAAVVAST